MTEPKKKYVGPRWEECKELKLRRLMIPGSGWIVDHDDRLLFIPDTGGRWKLDYRVEKPKEEVNAPGPRGTPHANRAPHF
jgi:hypothetical protein